MNLGLRLLVCATILSASTALAHADGIGTSVSGSLTIGNLYGNAHANYFDPATFGAYPGSGYNSTGNAPGFVPATAGNAASPTVTIGPGVEFQSVLFSPPLSFSADFTGTTLSIQASSTGVLNPFEVDFTDTVFASFTQLTSSVISPGAGTLPGLTYTFSGDTLKVFYAGSTTQGVIANTTFAYNQPAAIAATPEPSTFALLATGLGGITTLIRRKRRQA